MSQLQLLNTTVTAMALAVNKVLTACYHAVYDDAVSSTSSSPSTASS